MPKLSFAKILLNQILVALLACLVMVTSAAAQQSAKLLDKPQTTIIIDSSGSMWGELAGAPSKLVALRSATNDLINRWQFSESYLGLASYGHRRQGDCNDFEIVVENSGSPAELSRAVSRLRGVGRTVIGSTLEAVSSSLVTAPAPSSIILVADGPENCKRDLCALADKIAFQGNIDVHVLALGMKEEEAETLRCIPQKTGGLFLEANSLNALRGSMLRLQSFIEAKQVTQGVRPVALELQTGQFEISPEQRVETDRFTVSEESEKALASLQNNAESLAQRAEDNVALPGANRIVEIGNTETSLILQAISKPGTKSQENTALPVPSLPNDTLAYLNPNERLRIQQRLTFEAEKRAIEEKFKDQNSRLRDQMRRTMNEAGRQLSRERDARVKLEELKEVQETAILNQNQLLASLRDTLSGETDKKIRLANELAAERLQLRRSLENIQSLRQVNSDLNDVIQVTEERVTELQDELTLLKQEKQDTKQAMNLSERRFGELERVLEVALTELETLKNDRNDLRLRVANLREREANAEQLEAAFTKADKAASKAKSEKDALQRQLLQEQANQTRMRAQFNQLQLQSTTLLAKNKQLSDIIAKSIETDQALRVVLSERDTSILTLKNQVAVLSQEKEVALSQNAELAASLQANAETSIELRDQLEQQGAVINSLKGQLASLTETQKATRQAYIDASEEAAGAKRSLQQLRFQGSSSNNQVSALQDRIQTLEAMLQRSEAQRKYATSASQNLTERQQQLTSALEDANARLREANRVLECENIGRENGRLICLSDALGQDEELAVAPAGLAQSPTAE